ncbi:MAG: hypothetical protein R3C14_30685 [Caldilineaceae bacterium]
MQTQKLQRSVVSLMVIGLVAVGGTMWWSGPADAKGQCHSINTTQTTVADFANFTTAGEIKSGFLKGTTKFTGDASALTQITGTNSPPVEPQTFSYTGDLKITTAKGTLTTRSVGAFESASFGRGAQFDRVIAGTGLYADAEGFLYFNFVADDTGGAFTSTVSGEICVQ